MQGSVIRTFGCNNTLYTLLLSSENVKAHLKSLVKWKKLCEESNSFIGRLTECRSYSEVFLIRARDRTQEQN